MAKCYLDRGRGLPVRFDMLFKGFDHFTESLIAALILFGVSMMVVLPFLFVFSGVIAAIGGLSSRTLGPGCLGAILLG